MCFPDQRVPLSFYHFCTCVSVFQCHGHIVHKYQLYLILCMYVYASSWTPLPRTTCQFSCAALSVYLGMCIAVFSFPSVRQSLCILVSHWYLTDPDYSPQHLFALVLVLCSVSEISFPYASFSVPVLCVLVSQVLCAPLCLYTSVSVYQYLVLLPLHFCVSDTCNRAYVCVKYLFMPVCLCVLVAMCVFLCLYES